MGSRAIRAGLPTETLAVLSSEFEKRFDQLNQTMDVIDSKANNVMAASIAVVLAVLGFALVNDLSDCAEMGVFLFVIAQVVSIVICLWAIKVTEERVTGFLPVDPAVNAGAMRAVTDGLDVFYATKMTKLEEQCLTLNKRANRKADFLMVSQIIFAGSALALFVMALAEIYI